MRIFISSLHAIKTERQLGSNLASLGKCLKLRQGYFEFHLFTEVKTNSADWETEKYLVEESGI